MADRGLRETRQGYHPNNVSFGKFMLSEQARRPAVQAARHIRDVAKKTAARSDPKRKGRVEGQPLSASYHVNRKPAPVTIDGNPRAIAEVYNNSKYAARREFGDDTKKGRKQGGTHGKGDRNLRQAGMTIFNAEGLW